MPEAEIQPVEKTFMASFQQVFDIKTLPKESQDFVKNLGRQQKSDFASSAGGYFSHESQALIAKESAERLAKALEGQKPRDVELSVLQSAWQKIVMDFYQSKCWGQAPQKTKPPKILSEDQKRVRELAPYIWVAFQAWIVMKLVISYFGLEAADNPDETPWFLYLALAFSFGSLVVFAWRRFKKGE